MCAPHDAAAWLGLSQAFAREGRRTAALGAARRAVAESPALVEAQLMLAMLCGQVGYAADAVSALEAAARLVPHDAAGVANESDFARPRAYLRADPLHVEGLRSRLQLESGVRHVGIVWHGNRDSARDRWRIAPLPVWAPLAQVDGIRFHALQLDAAPAECSQAPFPLVPAYQLIGDMDDAAALIELMDLVISVDTAVAHLAGALGRPVWMPLSVLGDYRWGIARTDSSWYGSLRIFRQCERDDWTPVFEEIATALR